VYEALLRDDMTCFRCGWMAKNIAGMKVHLEEEWKAERRRMTKE
jgi:aprataxin